MSRFSYDARSSKHHHHHHPTVTESTAGHIHQYPALPQMPKRSGGNRQLRPEEVALEDEQSGEPMGTFRVADAATLKKRRILKSRGVRRKKKKTTSSEGTRPNLFAGFSGLTQSTTDEDTKRQQTGVYGISGGGGDGRNTKSTTGNAEKADAENNDVSFVRRRRKLNQSFHKWVQRQMIENEFSDWTIGVQDYITHMQKLKKRRKKERIAPKDNGGYVVPAELSKTTTKKEDKSDAADTDADDGNEIRKFVTRAKVMKMDSESEKWQSQGLGELRLLVDKTTNKSRIVVYDDCKQLKVNMNLYSGISFKRQGKKRIFFVAKTSDDGEFSQYFLSVKSPTVADGLKEALEAAIK